MIGVCKAIGFEEQIQYKIPKILKKSSLFIGSRKNVQYQVRFSLVYKSNLIVITVFHLI